MKALQNLITLVFATIAVCGPALAQQSDMSGSADYPGLPRVAGTTIIGYSNLPYDAGGFVTSSERNNFDVARPEGERTRILYLGGEDLSTLQIFRNYEKAFADFGVFEIAYSCTDQDCPRPIGLNLTWALPNRIANVMNQPQYLHNVHDRSLEPKYIYGKATKEGSTFHVSMYTVRNIDERPGIPPGPVVHVEVVREVAFEAALVQQSGTESAIARGRRRRGYARVCGLPGSATCRTHAYRCIRAEAV